MQNLVEQKYSIIYADPPWNVKRGPDWNSNGPSKPLPYPTMSIENIKALPVKTLAANDAHLYPKGDERWHVLAFWRWPPRCSQPAAPRHRCRRHRGQSARRRFPRSTPASKAVALRPSMSACRRVQSLRPGSTTIASSAKRCGPSTRSRSRRRAHGRRPPDRRAAAGRLRHWLQPRDPYGRLSRRRAVGAADALRRGEAQVLSAAKKSAGRLTGNRGRGLDPSGADMPVLGVSFLTLRPLASRLAGVFFISWAPAYTIWLTASPSDCIYNS